jgi:hypothetical protein
MICLIYESHLCRECDNINALHNIDSWSRFVAELIAIATRFFREAAQDRDTMPCPAHGACLRCYACEAR